MCNIRIQRLAGIGGNISPQQIASSFKSQALMAIERRRRWVSRFKKLPSHRRPVRR